MADNSGTIVLVIFLVIGGISSIVTFWIILRKRRARRACAQAAALPPPPQQMGKPYPDQPWGAPPQPTAQQDQYPGQYQGGYGAPPTGAPNPYAAGPIGPGGAYLPPQQNVHSGEAPKGGYQGPGTPSAPGQEHFATNSSSQGGYGPGYAPHYGATQATQGTLGASSAAGTTVESGSQPSAAFKQTWAATMVSQPVPGDEAFMEAMKRELSAMASADPPQLFGGKYVLLNERVAGGQALVNFARDASGGYYQYAIKCGSLCLLCTTAWTYLPLAAVVRATCVVHRCLVGRPVPALLMHVWIGSIAATPAPCDKLSPLHKTGSSSSPTSTRKSLTSTTMRCSRRCCPTCCTQTTTGRARRAAQRASCSRRISCSSAVRSPLLPSS
jgi:hypothetical protein